MRGTEGVFMVLAACVGTAPDAPPDAPPDASSSQCPVISTPSVTLGFGTEGTTPSAPDAVVEQVSGSQGLSHVVVGARMSGLGPTVALRFEARDAFTNGLLGEASLPTTTAQRFDDTPPGHCEVRRVWLVLHAPFPGGAGLATVRVTASVGNGRSATDAQRVWLGRSLPTCVPNAEVTPSVTPLILRHPTLRREDAEALRDDDTLTPVSAGDALLGVASLGFAASAITLSVTLAKDTASGRQTLRTYQRAPALDMVTVGAVPRRIGMGCVAPVTVRLPVEAEFSGRALVLVFQANDGLGHQAIAERTVHLRGD